MKHILTPIFLMGFLFPSLALGETVTFDELVYREGLFYKHSTDVMFTGKVTKGGQQWTFKDGKAEGLATHWHENGQKEEEAMLKDGKEVSKTKWDEEGNEIK